MRSPNTRGDDVAELQSLLNRLGFDCGRVDGIFGPLLVNAISEFQTNMGIEANGICTPEFVVSVRRMATQTGDGPGVAVVRESIDLFDADARDTARIVVGYFTGIGALALATSRRIKEAHPLTTSVESDVLSQAQAANRFRADVYVGLEASHDAGCTIYYYEVPTFVSVGGRNLARRIAAAIASRVPELSVTTLGVRHPLLRETRMTAVLCSMAPAHVVSLKTAALSSAIHDALEMWRHDPLTEL